MRVEAYLNLNKSKQGVVTYSLRDAATHKVVGYAPRVLVRDATLVVRPGEQRRARELKERNVHAWVAGERDEAPRVVKGAWRPLRYNPFLFDTFVDGGDLRPVHRARLVLLDEGGAWYLPAPDDRRVGPAPAETTRRNPTARGAAAREVLLWNGGPRPRTNPSGVERIDIADLTLNTRERTAPMIREYAEIALPVLREMEAAWRDVQLGAGPAATARSWEALARLIRGLYALRFMGAVGAQVGLHTSDRGLYDRNFAAMRARYEAAAVSFEKAASRESKRLRRVQAANQTDPRERLREALSSLTPAKRVGTKTPFTLALQTAYMKYYDVVQTGDAGDFLIAYGPLKARLADFAREVYPHYRTLGNRLEGAVTDDPA